MLEFIIGMVIGVGFFVAVGMLDRQAFKYYLENGVHGVSENQSPSAQ